MQARTRAWSVGIIVLVIACFLIVFEPIRLSRRPDILRAGETVKESARLGPLYIYPPSPILNLGLDLRGGMEVVLKARNQAQLTYEFSKAIVPAATGGSERSEMQARVAELLRPLELSSIPSIDIATKSITIRLAADDKRQAEKYRSQVKELLAADFGTEYGKLTAAAPKLITMTQETLSQVRSRLEQRVNRVGLSEAVLQTQMPDKIIVRLPGVSDPKAALRIIQQTGQLEWRFIPPKYEVAAEPRANGTGNDISFTDEAGNEVPNAEVITASQVIVRGDQLEPNARVMPGSQGPMVEFTLKPDGSKTFHEFTRRHKGKHIAVVLDGEIITAPVVKSAIKGRGVIEGMSSTREAKWLEVLLNSGALPIPLDVSENRSVSASLGKDSLSQSMIAGLVGMIVVLVFMALYYRLPGLLANAALIVYCLLLLTMLKLFNATLTLPGIFGIILSIGMAVDANVIIFERLKEELRGQKTLRSAVEAGFNRAWTAILDSNVCSILTALVLIGLGTAAIKGFAITLLIGVVCSLFTAVTVTRLFMQITTGTGVAKKLWWFGV